MGGIKCMLWAWVIGAFMLSPALASVAITHPQQSDDYALSNYPASVEFQNITASINCNETFNGVNIAALAVAGNGTYLNNLTLQKGINYYDITCDDGTGDSVTFTYSPPFDLNFWFFVGFLCVVIVAYLIFGGR
jgi:hypothetical protein